jgi:hypothetical protein
MATVEDIKIYAANTLTVGVTSLTQLEIGLKIVLLLVTIGYTLSRWWEIKENRKKNKNK